MLERASLELLLRPELGGQIVAQICSARNLSASRTSDLLELLDAGLESARMAREGGRARGEAFIEAVEDALDHAGQQGVSSETRLGLAGVWARNGLPVPAILELQPEQAGAGGAGRGASQADKDAILEALFENLIKQAGGEPLAVYTALTEVLPTLPRPLRAQLVAHSTIHSAPIHTSLTGFWLLDPDPGIRLTAARGLAVRLDRGTLTGRLRASLVLLRSWMPDDEARREVDRVVKDAMRRRAEPEAGPAAWTVEGAFSSLPDGAGAQSIAIALRSGPARKVAMILLKQGYGVKDAFTIACQSAREQEKLLQRHAEEAGSYPLSLTSAARLLGFALGDGLANGYPPAPGLLETVALTGLIDLRPGPASARALLAGLASAPHIAALSAQARGRLINGSRDCEDRYAVLDSWFEDSDDVHDLLDHARNARDIGSDLWKWLENRREWWAVMLARAAAVLEDSVEQDARRFAACAMALCEGRNLRKIPVMDLIHCNTIDAWAMNDMVALDPDMEDMEDLEGEGTMVPPRPERKGEFTRLLKRGGLSHDWFDGYVSVLFIAPEEIDPSSWMTRLLGQIAPGAGPFEFERFVELVVMRMRPGSEMAPDVPSLTARMAKRSKAAQRRWANGLLSALQGLGARWSDDFLASSEGRAMQAFADGSADIPLGGDLEELGQRLASRRGRRRAPAVEQSRGR